MGKNCGGAAPKPPKGTKGKGKGKRALGALLGLVLGAQALGCSFFQKHPEILTDEGRSLVLCVEAHFDEIILARDKTAAAAKVAALCGGRVTIDFILAILDASSKAHARAAAARAQGAP